MSTAADFRRLALSLPETAEASHFNNPDFRVAGKIFATLAMEKDGFGTLMLTPEQQAGMLEDAPDTFVPVKGGWGKQGATLVRLASANEELLLGVLQVAWKNKAPKRLLR